MKSSLKLVFAFILIHSISHADTLKFQATEGCGQEVTLKYDPKKISKEKLEAITLLHPENPNSLSSLQNRSVKRMDEIKKDLPAELQENYDSIYRRALLWDLIDTKEAKYSKDKKPDIFIDKKIKETPLIECASIVDEFKKIAVIEQNHARFLEQWHDCAAHQVPSNTEKEELQFDKNWDNFYQKYEIEASSKAVNCD